MNSRTDTFNKICNVTLPTMLYGSAGWLAGVCFAGCLQSNSTLTWATSPNFWIAAPMGGMAVGMAIGCCTYRYCSKDSDCFGDFCYKKHYCDYNESTQVQTHRTAINIEDYISAADYTTFITHTTSPLEASTATNIEEDIETAYTTLPDAPPTMSMEDQPKKSLRERLAACHRKKAPAEFNDPIHLSLMNDPIMLRCGDNFDLESLLEIKKNNTKLCPCCRKDIHQIDLDEPARNTHLRGSIIAFVEEQERLARQHAVVSANNSAEEEEKKEQSQQAPASSLTTASLSDSYSEDERKQRDKNSYNAYFARIATNDRQAQLQQNKDKQQPEIKISSQANRN